MAVKKGGLGRGFDSLFTENSVDSSDSIELRISQIEPNRNQPRKIFDEDALNDLAESIKKHGLIQPLLVRPLSGNTYQIVAGERRWRASRLAGLEKVPAVIRELDDTKAAEIALIENLQREDLNAVEEALGYKNLIEKFAMTQEMVAESVGKSRPAVANALRLLELDSDSLDALSSKQISAGHARALLSTDDLERRREALELSKKGASVREIERFVKQVKASNKEKSPKNKLYTETEISLSRTLGRRIKIDGNGKSGKLTVEFFDEKDLFFIAERLAGKNNG